MTNGEVRVLETEVVIFQTDSKQENLSVEAVEESGDEVKFGEPTIRAEIKDRFARLKKSLRRRSASIL